ncbi:MAG: hypothetical protein LH614_06435 [Pyrinomonadaceae bacterium]|nr:hypothetical protein [Pyrinomonadaceae bacterium]
MQVIEIEESLIAEIDGLAKSLKINSGENFSDTLREVIRKLKFAQMEKRTIEAYEKFPQQPEEYEIWQDEQVWEDE